MTASPPSASPPPASPGGELESTAELPVLDPAGSGAPHPGPDTWILQPGARAALAATSPGAAAPVAPAADEVQQLQANLQGVAAKLREAQELLGTKAERLTQVELARDEAHAAHTAAEARVAALAAERAQREAEVAQQARLLEEARRARAAAEQRAAAADEELARARELVSASSERAAQLQRLESVSRTQREHEVTHQQVLAAQGRTHTTRLLEELRLERERALGHFEALQTVESRRLIAESFVTELHHEAAARAGDVARMTRELASRDARTRELQSELEEQTGQLARLEQQVSSLTTRLAQRDTQLRDTRREAQALQVSVARLQDEITALGERERALETAAQQQRGRDGQQQSELQRLSGELGELTAALGAARAEAAAAAAHNAAQQSELAAERERGTRLENALSVERQRSARVEEELARVRDELEEWGGALRSAQQERNAQLAAVSAAQARAHALEQEVAEQRAAVQALWADCETRAARVRELETQLRNAGGIPRPASPPAEPREHGVQLREPESSAEPRRAAAEDAHHAWTDTGAHPELREAGRQFTDTGSAPPEPAPDGATRLLIRGDGEREVVHVLGRKTNIGRTPDNDLRIEAKYVSRHHAVILVGPVHTIIEDLNSTNGVLVNGKRISRQVLRDGDHVAIGRALYRFAVRRPSDKR